MILTAIVRANGLHDERCIYYKAVNTWIYYHKLKV